MISAAAVDKNGMWTKTECGQERNGLDIARSTTSAKKNKSARTAVCQQGADAGGGDRRVSLSQVPEPERLHCGWCCECAPSGRGDCIPQQFARLAMVGPNCRPKATPNGKHAATCWTLARDPPAEGRHIRHVGVVLGATKQDSSHRRVGYGSAGLFSTDGTLEPANAFAGVSSALVRRCIVAVSCEWAALVREDDPV